MALIDLFCCSGGFSLGAHKAGFEVAAAYDLDPILTSSFKTNFDKTRLIPADIGILTADDVRSQVGSRIQGVFGGPPCQGFSDIGRRDPEDPRRHLIAHFFRLVADLEPDFFIMENVRGLAYKDSRTVLDEALGQLGDRYRLMGPLILDAADFGAATRRRRLFVVGLHRDRGDPMSEADLAPFRKAPATVRHAIGDLASARALERFEDGFDRWKIGKLGRPSLYAAPLRAPDGIFTGHRIVDHKPEVKARFAEVPQGGMDLVGRHPRLDWNGQCPTLRAGTGADKGSFQAVRPLHPSEPRVITVREAARLQGFPDVHRFHPTIWHSFRMIGNSVSPIIAEAIFRAISAKIESKRDRRLAA
jgi:DNA (cytosine-5)-methyltransferase 1